MKRRTFVAGSSLALLQSSLQGCSLLVCKPDPTCLFEQHIPSNSGLLIDAHAHFFNGSDLQVKRFIEQVAGRDLIDWAWLRTLAGGILQHVAWHAAPTVKEEMAVIEKAQLCSEPEREQLLLQNRREQFDVARAEFVQQVNKLRMNKSPAFMSLDFASLEETLPASYEQLFQTEDNKESANFVRTTGYREIIAAFKFFVEMLQYRYVSAHNYLITYNRPSRKIDLVIGHLVDYDWFLDKGNPTPSEIPDQIALMGEIAKLSNGIVNYFTPYCPLRHVAWNSGIENKNFNPLEEVKKAVELNGALGVKLYPPMGFSLWGNQVLQKRRPWLWKEREFLPDICKTDDFGQKLDECLAELYAYCQKNSVPITAHTAISNLTDDCFRYVFDKGLLNDLVTKEFPDLKICFGHFGGFGWSTSQTSAIEGEKVCSSDNSPFWRELVELIKEADESPGLFIDTGFFSKALEDKQGFTKLLGKLLDDHPVLISRMLYGTDWKMMVTEPKANLYLETFESVLEEPMIKSLTSIERRQAIMGRNSATFLGLAKGEGNGRSRSERFYRGRRTPHWFDKI